MTKELNQGGAVSFRHRPFPRLPRDQETVPVVPVLPELTSDNLILTSKQLAKVADIYTEKPAFVFDVETLGDDRGQAVLNNVVWLSLASSDHSCVIPMGHPNGEYLGTDFPLLASGVKKTAEGKELRDSDYSKDVKKAVHRFAPPPAQLTPAEVFDVLRPIFYTSAVKIGHNVKFDIKSVTKYLDGIIPFGPYFCTMIASYLVDNRYFGKLGLADCVLRELGYVLPKGIGECIENHSFEDVAKYSLHDSVATWDVAMALGPQLKRKHLVGTTKLEMDDLEPLCEMELTGAPIDLVALHEVKADLDKQVETAKVGVYRAAGRVFNLNSNVEKQNLLFSPKSLGGQGLRGKVLTDTGKKKQAAGEAPCPAHFSTSADALQMYEGNPLVDAMLVFSDLNKLMSTYIIPYAGGEVTRTTAGKVKVTNRESLLINGRAHTTFNPIGAETGRFSCVAGSTVLPTSRGSFSFASYLPQDGDLVLTHEGRWMPILRKIYKGLDQMFRVVLANGAVLECTADHRLYTLGGWRSVRDLSVGDEVCSYGGVEEVRHQLGESTSGGGGVLGDGPADSGGSGSFVGGVNSDGPSVSSGRVVSGEVEGRAGASVLPLEDGGEEPHAGQEWFPTPELQGGGAGRAWVPAGEGRDKVRAVAPVPDGPVSGAGESPSADARPSHRPGPVEQQPGQPGGSDSPRASGAPQPDDLRGTSRVLEISPVGAMGVWDIEVAGDHSYLAQGFLNHNSKEPNLQNIPNAHTPNGKKIRNLFYAGDDDMAQVVADYSQIEPRVIASFSGDKRLIQNYIDGGDVYTLVGGEVNVDRPAGKVLVLAISYGIGPDHIAHNIGCTKREAQDLMAHFDQRFPSINRYKYQVVSEVKRRRPTPYVTTLLGRRRYIPNLLSRDKGYISRGERQAFNTKIQGSAADLMKLAMVRAYRMIPPQARLSLTVHDELVTLVPKKYAEETAEAIRGAMEGIHVLKVPLLADVKIVTKWGDAK